MSQSSWEKKFGVGRWEPNAFFSYWQGGFEAPPAQPDPIQRETAETLLRKLIELNDPRHIPAGYILAVMLERKRLLKVKEQFMRDGRRVFIYEQPRTGDIFTIIDPALQLNQLEQVQRDVAALLEHGLNPGETTLATDANGSNGGEPGATASGKSTEVPQKEIEETAMN